MVLEIMGRLCAKSFQSYGSLKEPVLFCKSYLLWTPKSVIDSQLLNNECSLPAEKQAETRIVFLDRSHDPGARTISVCRPPTLNLQPPHLLSSSFTLLKPRTTGLPCIFVC